MFCIKDMKIDFFCSVFSFIWIEQNDLRAIAHESLFSVQIREKSRTEKRAFFKQCRKRKLIRITLFINLYIDIGEQYGSAVTTENFTLTVIFFCSSN